MKTIRVEDISTRTVAQYLRQRNNLMSISKKAQNKSHRKSGLQIENQHLFELSFDLYLYIPFYFLHFNFNKLMQSTRGKRFWQFLAYEIPEGKTVLAVLRNPRGEYGFDRCLARTRTTTTPKTNTLLHYGTNQKDILFCWCSF